MQHLTVTINPHKEIANTYAIVFEGDFDGDAKPSLQELQTLIDSAVPKTQLLFDFSKLNFLNSYAIGHMVSWHNAISQKEGRICVASVNKNVEDIFAIVGISNIFKIYPTSEEALNELKKSA